MIMIRKLLKYCIFIGVAATLLLGLAACNKNKESRKSQQIITVAPRASANVLHYAGTINPVSRVPITSPEDGFVSSMQFQYGDILKKNQLLYIIKSAKQHETFQSALTDYLKAKQTLDASRAKNQSTLQLSKDGIVSRDEVQEAQETYYSDELAFFQAKAKFDQLLALHQITDFPTLSIEDVATITKLLSSFSKKIETVTLYSPGDGIALLPKDDKKSEVVAGKAVKSGDVLLYVGDISGISVEIEANEIDINQLNEGQKAEVTSTALPNVILHGYIAHINTQALSSGGGSPIFVIRVVVPKITSAQRKLIHIGMSAEVSITLRHKPQILIPVRAVLRQNGQTMVKVLDKTTGVAKVVPVVTGATTKDSVVIVSGLTTGDKVAVPNKAK